MDGSHWTWCRGAASGVCFTYGYRPPLPPPEAHDVPRSALIAVPLPSLFSAALYAALAIVIGAGGIKWLLLPRSGLTVSERAPVERAAAGAAMLASVAILLAVPARVALQLGDLLKPGEPWQSALSAILFSTQSGKAAQLQMVWAIATLLAFSVARAGRIRGWRAASVAVVVLAMTPGLGGHPASAARPILAMTVATMHVLAAGLWMGTLFHLWRVSRAGNEHATQRLVTVFHRVALSAAGVLVLSGIYASWTTLGGLGNLFSTAWGGLLATKLGILLIIVAFGVWQWRTADARRASGDRARFAHGVGTQLLLALAVIAVTGFLAGTAPPE